MDEKILNIFRRHTEEYVSGEDLSKELGVSRAAIWKHIEDLRRCGYTIEAQPHLGYRLLAVPDRLLAMELNFGLNTRFIGKRILSYDTVDSTMDIAYDLAAKTRSEGICVFAEAQRKGRGRLGRDWQSPRYKGICLSVILRSEISPNEAPRITQMAAVGIAKAIRSMPGLEALIKWPNDILIRGRKVGGILTEMNAELDEVRFLIVGIGININSKQSELPKAATSLKEESGKTVNRLEFTRLLLKELDKQYLILKEKGFAPILNEWRDFSATLGSRIKVDYKNRHIEGQAMDVDENGALLVRLDNGFTEHITAGDVALAR